MLGFGAPGVFGAPGALGGFGAPGAEGGAGDALALLPVSTFAPQKGHSSGKTPKTAFTRFPQFGQSADWSSPAGLKHIDIAPFPYAVFQDVKELLLIALLYVWIRTPFEL